MSRLEALSATTVVSCMASNVYARAFCAARAPYSEPVHLYLAFTISIVPVVDDVTTVALVRILSHEHNMYIFFVARTRQWYYTDINYSVHL